MGSDNESQWRPGSPDDMRISKSSTDPIVMTIPNLDTALSNTPYIASMNVNKSSRVHIGPKVVSITQNVKNTEGVRDVSCPRYVWTWLKESTRAERAALFGSIIALILCVSLVLYFVVLHKKPDPPDIAPHEWNITRQMWLARSANLTDSALLFSPLDLVIIQHTVTNVCFNFKDCATEVRKLQDYFIDSLKWSDIGYNFVVGNDGRVYEGRGWGIKGAHAYPYNGCSVGVAFIGDYRSESKNNKPTAAQVVNFNKLLEDGVKLGYLLSNYKVYAALDLTKTVSPGENLYAEMIKWPHYDQSHQYKNKTCQDIRTMIQSDIIITP